MDEDLKTIEIQPVTRCLGDAQMVEEITSDFEVPVFPFYLDREMLTGFLATLEDGFSLSSSVLQQGGGTSEASNKIGAEAGLGGGLISSLFRLKLSGGIDNTVTSEDRDEYSFILQHTEASLFNRCRSFMRENSISIDLAEDSIEPTIGDIVEIKGVLHRNPLADLLDLMELFGGPQVNQARGTEIKSKKTQLSNVVDNDSFQMLKILRDSMENANLSDFVLTTDLQNVPNVILTLRKSVDIDATLDLSVGGVCSVIGKVTNSYGVEEEIPLYRRTILKHMSSENVKAMFKDMEDSEDFTFDTSKIVVQGGIQILPLAVFI